MPRSIRDVARLLLLAGGAGLPAVSLVANPPTPPSAVVHVSPDQLRSEAMRVELAWLADPNLYQLPLTVRVKDQALEVSGQVPDEQVHQWVLQTSRQSCYLPIHDALTVSVVHHTSVPKEQLLATAREALARHLAGRAAGMQAAATEDGQVVLRGEVPTLTDKLTASRALRGLPGCSRVVNRLTVRGEVPEPQPPAIQQVKATLAPGEHTGGSAPPPSPTGTSPSSHADHTGDSAKSVPPVDDAIPVPQVQHAPSTPYVAPPDAATLPSGLPAVRYQVLDHGYGPQLVRIEASTPPPPVVQATVVRREIVTEAKPPLRERLLNGWRTPPRPTVKTGGTTPPQPSSRPRRRGPVPPRSSRSSRRSVPPRPRRRRGRRPAGRCAGNRLAAGAPHPPGGGDELPPEPAARPVGAGEQPAGTARGAAAEPAGGRGDSAGGVAGEAGGRDRAARHARSAGDGESGRERGGVPAARAADFDQAGRAATDGGPRRRQAVDPRRGRGDRQRLHRPRPPPPDDRARAAAGPAAAPRAGRQQRSAERASGAVTRCRVFSPRPGRKLPRSGRVFPY
ncbi:MAG: BON domain-containing protein [Gemmataceae bacterium]